MTTPPLTNPLLDQLAQAQQQTLAPPRIPPPTAPMAAPPTITAPSMGTGQLPQMPSPTPPIATKPLAGTATGDTLIRQKLLQDGPPIDSLYKKISTGDFGQAHPLAGKLLGGLAEIGGKIGDTLANAAPGIGREIPGTTQNYNLHLNRANTALGQDEKIASEEAAQGEQKALTGEHTAQTNEIPITRQREDARESSEEGLRGEQVKNLQSEEAERTSPSFTVHDTDEGPLLVGKDGTAQHLTVDGTPVGPKIKLTESQPIMGTDGKPHTYMLDEQGNKKVDLGVHYERPNVTNVNAGDKADAALKKQVYTAFTPAMDSAERFNVMSRNYEDAVKTHDQQAMLSLLYNHMGMTMGLQKGARMTQALIQEAQKSQPWLQGIKAKFDSDGYLTGVTLSPRQMQEMVHNAQGRYSEDVQKARNESQYLGAKDDGPERTPNASTINYYTSLANGDQNKAKQLAAQDGWMVK
jgi:hypothetical protein